MKDKLIIGLDVGDRRIGVAISDELGLIAHGLELIQRKGIDSDISRLEEILNRHKIKEVVVGLPKRMNGSIGKQAKKVLGFVDHLKAKIALPIKLRDERLTTVSSERTLIEAGMSRRKRRMVIDKLSARLILQNYLDSKGK